MDEPYGGDSCDEYEDSFEELEEEVEEIEEGLPEEVAPVGGFEDEQAAAEKEERAKLLVAQAFTRLYLAYKPN